MDNDDPGTADEPAAQPAPQRDKERTRAAILDAAALMILEHGSGVSLADIARRAGVSKGALTHHFPHRLELEKALVRRSNEQFWADRKSTRLNSSHSTSSRMPSSA